jgi:hypothetical protein
MRNDATYLAIMTAFFMVAALFVMACDKIIGPDEVALEDESVGSSEPEDQKVAA